MVLNSFSSDIIESECDGQPICVSKNKEENLKALLARALNKNQILILSEVKCNRSKTITLLLTKLSRKSNIPLSTLKLNAKILRQLNLIKFNNFSNVELTSFGDFIVQILGGDNPR